MPEPSTGGPPQPYDRDNLAGLGRVWENLRQSMGNSRPWWPDYYDYNDRSGGVTGDLSQEELDSIPSTNPVVVRDRAIPPGYVSGLGPRALPAHDWRTTGIGLGGGSYDYRANSTANAFQMMIAGMQGGGFNRVNAGDEFGHDVFTTGPSTHFSGRMVDDALQIVPSGPTGIPWNRPQQGSASGRGLNRINSYNTAAMNANPGRQPFSWLNPPPPVEVYPPPMPWGP